MEAHATLGMYSEIVHMAARVRIMIADDHPLVRSGLRVLLEREGEFEVVAEAADGYEAIDLAALHKPDVILLDVGMPRLNGPDAALSISQKVPNARIDGQHALG